MKAQLLRLWTGYKRVAHWIGERQATIIYTLLYVLVVGPVALVRRPFSDPFQYRKRRSPSFWVPRPSIPPTLEAARRQ